MCSNTKYLAWNSKILKKLGTVKNWRCFLIARLPISAVLDHTELGAVTEYVKIIKNNSVYLHGENKAAWSGFEYGLVDKTICGFGEKMGCMGR